ncbi:MAG: phosphate acyltransferase, partial [Alphaproteobacteria bacterium]
DEVDAAYAGQRLRYGPDYIIPVPFDPRLVVAVPMAVARAAMDSGVARKPIIDEEAYRNQLSARLDPTAGSLQRIFEALRAEPKRVVFAEGEEEHTIRAAIIFRDSGYGTPVLIGREERIRAAMEAVGVANDDGLEMHNARLSEDNSRYTDFLYERLQRKGSMYRDCQRMVNQDRNVFAACMLANGDADALITGLTRRFAVGFEEIRRVLDPRPGRRLFGLTMMLTRGRTVFIADTAVHEEPTSVELADIAAQAAAQARLLGHEPRVALLSFSNFGNPPSAAAERIRDAVSMLDSRAADFEYDGEMAADVALNPELMQRLYPFCRLSGPANVLVMPDLHAANIAAKLLTQLCGGTVIGPILHGLSKPVQILQMGANVSDIVNMAALAAHEAIGAD